MTTSIVRDQARGEHARSRVAEVAAGKSPVLLIADLAVQADIRRVGQEAFAVRQAPPGTG
jgi:hypothetical protein